ncbi:MAG TPA: SpoIIE family protein phosphatase [Sedimentisphaerales bacterium]|nr:SpoIIE family protein phosphatase [Sedimentisphaerales bacterium]
MAMTKLIISGPGGTEHVLLDPKGTTLGRSSDCDIVLDDDNVSRLHARLFQDPFGRWIVEDLESQNGVLIEGRHIKAQAVLPDEKISIHPFTLSLLQEFDQQMVPESSFQSTSLVIDDGLKEEVISHKADRDAILSATLIRHLNEIIGRLLGLSSPSELYSEACHYLSEMLEALVAFVRLPPSSEPLPNSPHVLACHFSRDATDIAGEQTCNLCLSKRVLDAVRSMDTPVIASSHLFSKQNLDLTVVDEHEPHLVFSARVNDGDVRGVVDALYVDILEDKAPKEMYEFVEAVSKQINFVRKSLLLSAARAERRTLDEQLSLARDIQSRLAPRGLERGFGIDVAVFYKPAMWVGGDYYDVWSLEDGRIAFAVGDVSGKGLPAAMIMSNLQAALRTTMTFCSGLSIVVEHVNRHLCHNLQDMFVTLFLGLFDPSKNELAYVNAGHIQPLIMRHGKCTQPLGKATNVPLGIFEGSFEMGVETIHPNTSLVVVTDGITEANSPNGDLFEMDRLVKLMTNSDVHSAQDLVQLIAKGVADFRQMLPQQDDITVFALVNHPIDSNTS